MDNDTARVVADEIAPPVRLEPCTELRLDQDVAWPVCAVCGWLEDDHAGAEPASATVTELPARAPWSRRLAS